MKQFLMESVLPLMVVCVVTAGLTWLLFDVRANAPAQPAVGTRSPVDRVALDETLAQALRTLETVRTTTAARSAAENSGALARSPAVGIERVAQAVPAAGPAAPAGPPAPDEMVSTVSALGEAIKAARNARTEEDLVYAEDRMRKAREQMEATCGAPGGALCASAREIRSLGF